MYLIILKIFIIFNFNYLKISKLARKINILMLLNLNFYQNVKKFIKNLYYYAVNFTFLFLIITIFYLLEIKNIFTLKEFFLYIFIILFIFIYYVIKKNFFICNILFSIILSIYSSELLLSLRSYNQLIPESQESLLEFVKKNNTSNNNEKVFPIIYPYTILNMKNLNYNFIPVSSLIYSRTAVCNEDNFWTIINTDRYGFNNPDNIWDQKEIDILIMGNSFSAGNCVKPEDNWVSLLRNKYNIINLAIGGNGPLLMLAALKEYGLDYKTKKIIFQFYEANDTMIEFEKKNKILNNYILQKNFTQNLKLNQQNINNTLINLSNNPDYFMNDSKIRNLKKEFSITNILKLEKIRARFGLLNIDKEKLEYDLNNILSITREISYNSNSDYYFLYLPSLSSLVSNQIPSYLSRKELADLALRNNYKIIDLYKTFKNHKDPYSLFPKRKNNHYNKEGYFLVYQKINECLIFFENIANANKICD